jgi:ribosomal protein S16
MGVTNLRLARFGHRNNPFFRLVAIDSRKKLSAGPIEYVRGAAPPPHTPNLRLSSAFHLTPPSTRFPAAGHVQPAALLA